MDDIIASSTLARSFRPIADTVPSSLALQNKSRNFFCTENKNNITQLPLSLVEPSFYTVVIGKGKIPKLAPGNTNLRLLVKNKLQEYANANKSKIGKSCIVTDIYYNIQESCEQEGGPAFLRYDGHSYTAVGEPVARERITSAFRDGLSDCYKSSSKNKVAKRRIANKEKTEKDRKMQEEHQHQQAKPRTTRKVANEEKIEKDHPKKLHEQEQVNNKPFTRNNDKARVSINHLPKQLSRINTSNAPKFESFAPVDRSVFDTPLSDFNCDSSASSLN
jgi:hypothetical protein